jgi:hypothetical protein
MKREAMISLPAAVLSLALLPAIPSAQAASPGPDTSNANSSSARADAQKMVPAEAVLRKTLDARKLQAGEQFDAILNGKVKLKDGQELPHGTVLVGTIATDNMQQAGDSRLALRFTQARLKDGKSIPIEATIIGISPASSFDTTGNPDTDGSGALWTPQTLRVDQVGAIRGVDLHSRIDGNNSGVFVAANKHDVKLSEGSRLALAIAAKQDLNRSNGF